MDKTINAAAAGTVKVGDFTVNRMGYGAMRITGEGVWGPPKDRQAAISVLKRAVELGVNFIDTADSYGPEVSEDLIHEALYPYGGLVIATKGGLVRPGPGDWRPDGSPEHLREALEGSLSRLGLTQIHVYQFHRPDPKVPFKESLQALISLKEEGKIRHLALSNVNADQLQQAMEMTEIASVQNHYNFEHRKDSEPVLKLCEQSGIAFIPYFPIGGGMSDYNSGVLQKIAGKHSATPHQIALAWLLAHSPAMLPIPGTGSVDHLEENIAAASLTLDDEDMAQLDTLSD